jgi:hypothetical protein
MVRTISSSVTFFYKYIFSAGIVIGFGVSTVTVFLNPLRSAERWDVALTWVVGSLLVWWFSARIKRVRIDEKYLYISNYWKEVRVPLINVTQVRDNMWIDIHPVTIKLSISTSFGSSIVFIPRVRFSTLISARPAVVEIEDAVKNANWVNLSKKIK